MNEELQIINTLNAIIIDKSTKIKKDFVIVHEYNNGQRIPYYWDFNEETEEIIYDEISQANSLYKAKWNGISWEESATQEEIQKIEEERKKMFPIPNEPQSPEPNPLELAIAEMSAMQAIENSRMEQSIAELTILISQGGMNNV